MLELRPLRPDQYRQVAEWDWGPQENVDWERYESEMNAPQWAHFALYDGAEFVGCISLERDRATVAYHVATARNKVNPFVLAQVLLKMGFDGEATAAVARIPVKNRAAARLAIRCGMKEWGHTPTMRYFILTKQRYLRNGQL